MKLGQRHSDVRTRDSGAHVNNSTVLEKLRWTTAQTDVGNGDRPPMTRDFTGSYRTFPTCSAGHLASKSRVWQIRSQHEAYCRRNLGDDRASLTSLVLDGLCLLRIEATVLELIELSVRFIEN